MASVQNVSEFVLSFLAVYYNLVPRLFTKELVLWLVEVTSFYQQILLTVTLTKNNPNHKTNPNPIKKRKIKKK